MGINNGYTTLVTVQTALGIPSTDQTNDIYIQATIESVSRLIDNYTGRKFYSEAETNYYTPVSSDTLYVDDLLSVTTLKTDDDEDGTFETTWAETDYHLLPFNAANRNAPYTRIETSGYGNYSFPLGVRKAVQIVGTFGYCTTANLPEPVSEACKLQSIRFVKRTDAPFGVIGVNDMQQAVTMPELDPDVKMLLSPYVRRV